MYMQVCGVKCTSKCKESTVIILIICKLPVTFSCLKAFDYPTASVWGLIASEMSTCQTTKWINIRG